MEHSVSQKIALGCKTLLLGSIQATPKYGETMSVEGTHICDYVSVKVLKDRTGCASGQRRKNKAWKSNQDLIMKKKKPIVIT